MSEHDRYIRRCYELANAARAAGNHPFGALLVVDGRIVAEARNEAVTSGDPTRHAETELVASSIARVAADDRPRAVLYTSTEPCMMCAAAIYWSGIGSVVYGCSEAALARVAGDDFLVPCRDVFARGHRTVHVTGPVLEAEGLVAHQAYWSAESP